MRFTDLILLKEDPENSYLIDKSITQRQDLTVINGLVPFPILTSFALDRSRDIEIKSSDDIVVGRIKFLKTGNFIEDILSLPDDDLICFLCEFEHSSIVDRRYKFINDFLLIEEDYLSVYLSSFKQSSPIWGSYFHVDSQPVIEFSQRLTTTSFLMVENIEINNQIYYDNLFLAFTEINPFNRILKLYHLLELQFDLHTAYLIKTLYDLGGKEKEISNKLRDYTKDEDERLESLIKERCSNLERIVPLLNNISRFGAEAAVIFYDYGKSKNPLKRPDFTTIINSPDGFTRSRINSFGGYAFDSLVPKLAAYWIYRIRCCVAHNKFGEYVMTHMDENFVVEFGEPLLKEIIIQCFKN